MIIKFQQGGGLPLVSYTPVITNLETSTYALRPATDDKKDLTTKDLMELLKEAALALPNEYDLIINNFLDFALGSPLNTSTIETRYLSALSSIQKARFNKELFDESLEIVKSKGALNEFAITAQGDLVCVNNEGDYKIMSPEELEKGYRPLTNSELLNLRAYSPDLVFNNNILSVILNGISMELVTKMILNIVKELGTSESTKEGYTSIKNKQILDGINILKEAAENGALTGDEMSVDGLYKNKLITKSLAIQAKMALDYLKTTLPKNAVTLLKIKSDGTNKGVDALLAALTTSYIKSSVTFETDLQDETNASDLETSLPLNILKDIGGVDSYIDIDRGDGIHMSVRGTLFNLIKTPNGEPILNTSVANMLHQSGLQSIIKDIHNIQFGDQKITPEALSFITYNNTGITRTVLPIKNDGSVNLDLLEAYLKAETDLNLLGNRSPENIKAIYEKYGITSLLNLDGTYNQSKFAPFMITEGYTTDALSGLKKSDFVVEYNGDEDSAISLIQQSLAIGYEKNIQTPSIDEFNWYNPLDWFGWTDTIFKGVIYIPITNNVNTAVFGANQSLDYDEALIQEEKYQNFERMSNQRSTDASLLNI